MHTYEIINPSDQAFCDAPSDALAVLAIAALSEGRYAVKRDGFSGPLFLLGGHDEWFAAHANGATFETFMLANLAGMADVLATVRLAGERSALNDFTARAHKMAEGIRSAAAKRRGAESDDDAGGHDMTEAT